MQKNRKTIWQSLTSVVVATVWCVAAGASVLAQSSSASYQAVDFINAESGLSTSSSYQLNDSVDYYGGTANSGNYKECTGNAAVLSECGFTITPPPLPPSPPSTAIGGGGQILVGAGSIYYAHEDCNQIDCLYDAAVTQNREVEKPDQIEDVQPTETTSIGLPLAQQKPVFQLPDIKESLFNERAQQPITSQSEKQIESGAVTQEGVEKGSSDQAKFYRVVQIAVDRVDEELIKAKTAVWCEDLTCAPLKPSAGIQGPGLCSIYTFGGYQIPINCMDLLLIGMGGLLFILFTGRTILVNEDK